jgi:hypothetical protein
MDIKLIAKPLMVKTQAKLKVRYPYPTSRCPSDRNLTSSQIVEWDVKVTSRSWRDVERGSNRKVFVVKCPFYREVFHPMRKPMQVRLSEARSWANRPIGMAFGCDSSGSSRK